MAMAMGIALLLLMLYIGAYYLMVVPVFGTTMYPTPFEDERVFWRGDDGPLTTFFAPIHAVDRHIRPGVWSSPVWKRFESWEP